ncbi:MAG: NAD(P)H-dependent oxidoreductase, partial [Acidimicrobiia bacterium]|nr:NAD(P)H-dependent oxidoreductase [Acidimicrobiia bacterium]
MRYTPIRVLAIPGSLRRDSYNRALLGVAASVAPEWMEVEVYDDLGEVPLFNGDVADSGLPDGVAALRHAIAACDAVMIATPEYNQAVLGVVKNMIDWLSMGDPPESLEHKPVAVTGVTTGPWGTRLAQIMLRQMLLSCGAILLPQPFLYLRGAEALFDPSGHLSDDKVRIRLAEFVIALGEWAELLGGAGVGSDQEHP